MVKTLMIDRASSSQKIKDCNVQAKEHHNEQLKATKNKPKSVIRPQYLGRIKPTPPFFCPVKLASPPKATRLMLPPAPPAIKQLRCFKANHLRDVSNFQKTLIAIPAQNHKHSKTFSFN